MTCEAPIQRGPMKGRPATGTPAGYQRHRRADEFPCPACLTAQNKPNINRGARTVFDKDGQMKPVACRCATCGARDKANPKLTGGHRLIEKCATCRRAAC